MLHASWLMCVVFVLLLCICILKLWNVKGAVVREWAGRWRLATVLNSRKTCRKVFCFFFPYCYWELTRKCLIKCNCLAKRRESLYLQLTFPGSEFWAYWGELPGCSWCIPFAAAAPPHRCSGKDAQLSWAGGSAAEKGRLRGMLYWGLLAPTVTDPITVTILSKLLFVSHLFFSLILSSGFFQPREKSLQVPVLNPITTVTLSVFPKL